MEGGRDGGRERGRLGPKTKCRCHNGTGNASTRPALHNVNLCPGSDPRHYSLHRRAGRVGGREGEKGGKEGDSRYYSWEEKKEYYRHAFFIRHEWRAFGRKHDMES